MLQVRVLLGAPRLHTIAACGGERLRFPGWVIAGLILLGGVANLMMIPHPLWMQIGAIAAPLLGGWIVARLPVGGSAAVS